MDYQKYARELIGYMIENEQSFKFCHGDISEIARGEGAVLIYLMGGDGVCASEISQRFDINTSRVAAVLNTLSKKGFIKEKKILWIKER
ncbi:MarR family transcriptional regulator [Allocoprobacillus halotolerans]|uniref:MarR family transcriptional regulator n=1 Tax=Allocoprobacillus halotolerans TaxID=2944914 RepID=A0ABY5I5J7_9FIRM|nr:helix-turn-helix domain-containing protein [Allocoprobacillus halotolerans]UTY40340.1 MarR family transcriptional regulator [Allocoprobacillus halotolerans]